MPAETLIQNESAILTYYPETKIVHHTFLKPISGEEFREVLNTGIRTLEKHQAVKWLSDDRKNLALPDEDTEWSKTDWFPRAVKAGWTYWALVVPDDFLAKLNMKEFTDSYFDQGLHIAVFSKPDEALKWLEICDLPPKDWINRLGSSSFSKGA